MYSFIAAMGSLQSDGAATAAAQGSGASSILMLVIFVAIFYFLLIRPQKKRDKEQKEMLASMKKGDKIVTIGGIRGTIAVVKENTVVIKVDDNARIEFNKSAISQILNAKPVEADSEEKKTSKKSDAKLEIVENPSTEESKEKKAPAKRTSSKKAPAKKADEEKVAEEKVEEVAPATESVTPAEPEENK